MATTKPKRTPKVYDETKYEINPETGRHRKKVKAPGDKRPPNAYMLFSLEFLPKIREEMKKNNPKIKINELAKIVGQRWKELDADTKRRFTDASLRAVTAFRETHPLKVREHKGTQAPQLAIYGKWKSEFITKKKKQDAEWTVTKHREEMKKEWEAIKVSLLPKKD